jgi:hypothetical protein
MQVKERAFIQEMTNAKGFLLSQDFVGVQRRKNFMTCRWQIIYEFNEVRSKLPPKVRLSYSLGQ